MDFILHDLRIAARRLRGHPGFTAVAVTALALGIGATTAVFSVVYGVLLRPLPFPSADRLVRIVQTIELNAAPSRAGLAPDQFANLEDRARTLEEVGTWAHADRTLTGVAVPVRLKGAAVSAVLFSGLGVAPTLGRAIPR